MYTNGRARKGKCYLGGRDNLPKLLSRNQAGETHGKAKALFVIHERGKVINDSKWVIRTRRFRNRASSCATLLIITLCTEWEGEREGKQM